MRCPGSWEHGLKPALARQGERSFHVFYQALAAAANGGDQLEGFQFPPAARRRKRVVIDIGRGGGKHGEEIRDFGGS